MLNKYKMQNNIGNKKLFNFFSSIEVFASPVIAILPLKEKQSRGGGGNSVLTIGDSQLST